MTLDERLLAYTVVPPKVEYNRPDAVWICAPR
jgi:hypothetical protein